MPSQADMYRQRAADANKAGGASKGSCEPDFRHKAGNAGQVFATNRETKSSAGEIRLKQVCGTS
jgi:hypothetical protein